MALLSTRLIYIALEEEQKNLLQTFISLPSKTLFASLGQTSSQSSRWNERIRTATTHRPHLDPSSSSTPRLSCLFLHLHTPSLPHPQLEPQEPEVFPWRRLLTSLTAPQTAGRATTPLRGKMGSARPLATRGPRSSSAAGITTVGARLQFGGEIKFKLVQFKGQLVTLCLIT